MRRLCDRELTWGLIIAALRDITRQMDSLKAGSGNQRRPQYDARKTWEVRLRQDRSRRGGIRQGLGMKGLVWARGGVARARAAPTVTPRGPKEAFFGTCDIITLHMACLDATRGYRGHRATSPG